MCEARKRLRIWVERVACASAVTGRVSLDAATHLTWGIASELDDMEGTSGAGCVLELAKRWRSCCPWKGIERRDSHPRAQVFSALGQPVLIHGARPSRDKVHSTLPWGDPPLASGPRCR